MRWRLRSTHYLNVPGTEWEQNETNRDTGRTNRKRYTVPLLLDPNDPSYQTPPNSGEIIVCYAGKGDRHDVVFEGEPTPEMEPIDEEAKALSAKLEPKWKAPMGDGAFPGTGSGGFNDALLQQLNRNLETLINTQGIPKAAEQPIGNVGGIDAQAFADLQATVQKQAEMIERLMAGKPALEIDTDATPLPPPEAAPVAAGRRA